MMDALVLLSRFGCVYAASWLIVARPILGARDPAQAPTAILVAHFSAYAAFLIHYMAAVPYTAIGSLLSYLAVLLALRWLLLGARRSPPAAVGLSRDERFQVWLVWLPAGVMFMLLYYVYAYRFPGSGAQYHAVLNVVRHASEAAVAFPDLDRIDYGFDRSALFFPPAFTATALMLTAGVSGLTTLVSGIGLVHFTSFIGLMLFIALAVRELSARLYLSFLPLVFIATWTPGPNYAVHFMPDYNSFVGFCTVGGYYYVLRWHSSRHAVWGWLLLTTAMMAVNNRPWLVVVYGGLLLGFGDCLLTEARAAWVSHVRQHRRAVAACGLVVAAGLAWPVTQFELGAEGHRFGVSQSALERNYGAGDLTAYYSPLGIIRRLPEIAVAGWTHIANNFLYPWLSTSRGPFLPGYLTATGLVGLLVLGARRRLGTLRWRLPIALGAALILTGVLSPPSYPRSYLWLAPSLLLLACWLVNELYGIGAHRFGKALIHVWIGVALVAYAGLAGALHVGGAGALQTDGWLSSTPGLGTFFRNAENLRSNR